MQIKEMMRFDGGTYNTTPVVLDGYQLFNERHDL
jgi:hypothetical protein